MKQEYIEVLEERLKTKGYVFDKRCKEGKVTFVIYMQTVSQSALCIELELNENGVGRLFCTVIPTFPVVPLVKGRGSQTAEQPALHIEAMGGTAEDGQQADLPLWHDQEAAGTGSAVQFTYLQRHHHHAATL